jgi:hypothetical protein
MDQAVEKFEDEGRLVALVLRHHADLGAGVHFLTPGELTQQLAYMDNPAGRVIPPHVHNPSLRQVEQTGEVLMIRSGRLLVELFRQDKSPLAEVVLGPGDVVLLCGSPHGFKVLERCQMVEIKQGPYLGAAEKMFLFPENQ